MNLTKREKKALKTEEKVLKGLQKIQPATKYDLEAQIGIHYATIDGALERMRLKGMVRKEEIKETNDVGRPKAKWILTSE